MSDDKTFRQSWSVGSSREEIKQQYETHDSSSTNASKFYRGTHRWTIQNYSFVSKMPHLDSEVFQLGGLKFKMKIYPQDVGNGDTKTAIFAIRQPPIPMPFLVWRKFSVVNQKNSSCSLNSEAALRTISQESSAVSVKFDEDLLDKSKGFLGDDDTIVVTVYLEFILEVEPNHYHIPMPRPSLPDCMSNLLAEGHNSDVELVCGESSYKVHKCILSCRSPVFKAMFEVNMQENERNVVEIEDVNSQTLQAMLDFMYTDQKPNLQIAGDLLILADKYQMTDLGMVCQSVLVDGLNIKNAVDILVLADRYRSCREMKKIAIDFIVKNLETILTTDESLQKLMAKRTDLATEILVIISRQTRSAARV